MSDSLSHSCPTEGSVVMPCCGRTPFEVPRDDRMTLDESLVTCYGGYPKAAVERAAKAIIKWEIDNGYLVSHITEAEAMALAAIRELDIICDGNCDHAVHQPEHIAIRAAELAGRVQTEEKP